ncbi:ATP-binding protein [Solimonas terrae]|uniref:ATP-binding protein n=2 Tax=Solimonas terrae TaxID=1396819 RepID=A0A6M2BRP7_9GAMM|nr:ATP-binding protein [Solimonas terrae]
MPRALSETRKPLSASSRTERSGRLTMCAAILSGPDMSTHLAYRWHQQKLRPIEFVQTVQLDDLLGIDRQKAALIQNTRQFVAGKPANHVLLTGSRGTGKSSIVKALLGPFAAQGLRLVELAAHDLIDLPDVVAPLRAQPERFILYVDDFSVSANDPALTALKTALDGGIEEPPENVLVYATSNRRHLMPEMKKDNGEYHWLDDELHPGESTEEKISLSERFGLWLSFLPFTQDQYLDAVRLHLRKLGHEHWDEETEKLSLRWALNRASRSGRVARQFARDWAGRHA